MKSPLEDNRQPLGVFPGRAVLHVAPCCRDMLVRGAADSAGDSAEEEAWAPCAGGRGQTPGQGRSQQEGLLLFQAWGAEAHKLGCDCSGQAFLGGRAGSIYTSCWARSTPQEVWEAGSGALGRG